LFNSFVCVCAGAGGAGWASAGPSPLPAMEAYLGMVRRAQRGPRAAGRRVTRAPRLRFYANLCTTTMPTVVLQL
jgi:hypothetical protein